MRTDKQLQCFSPSIEPEIEVGNLVAVYLPQYQKWANIELQWYDGA